MKLSLDKLQRQLGYTFKDPELATLALTHRSYGGKNNERLEFLGDSIVNFLIAEELYTRFPEAREGQLSRLRALLVRGQTLAELAREFKLGDFLLLGSGELKSGGFRRESILADAVEALLGAIYLDTGMEACRERVAVWFSSRLAALSVTDLHNKDAKTRLQEYLQSRQLKLPEYELLSIEGKAHAQTFKVNCMVEGLLPCVGEGSSRRIAEQQSARRALIALGEEVKE